MDIFAKIASLHPLVTYLLLFCIFMGLTLISSLAIHRFVDAQMRKRHNDIAGFFFGVVGVVGVVYGVLLAFITVGVWEQYNSAAETVDKEAFAAQLMAQIKKAYIAGLSAQSLPERYRVQMMFRLEALKSAACRGFYK